MVPSGRLLAFAAVALIIIVIPGPSVLFVVGRALAHGRRVALASVLGNEAGSQMLVLGAVFALIATISDAAWSLVASGARAWFGRSPRRLELVGGAGGLAMIGLGITVAVTGRKS
jgi:threonine/homoserine/homoserine lactone efflux protein